jgi:hypothetical protein
MSLLQGKAREETLSSGYTFYRGEAMVAQMTTFIAGNSQFNLGEDIFILRSYRSGLLTERWMLLCHGKSLATADFPFLQSKCQLNYKDQEHERELTLRTNSWSWSGNQFKLSKGSWEIGSVELKRDWALLDLPEDIPLPVQLFIFRLAKVLRDSQAN